MKKTIYIVLGLILVAVIGRSIWAIQQVKNDATKTSSTPTQATEVPMPVAPESVGTGKVEQSGTTSQDYTAIERVYVSGKDVVVNGRGLDAVVGAIIDGDTCLVHMESGGFKESYGKTNITLVNYAQCLPTTKPNYISAKWNLGIGKGQQQGRFIINQ